jgi:hypothetical protein
LYTLFNLGVAGSVLRFSNLYHPADTYGCPGELVEIRRDAVQHGGLAGSP